MELADDGAETKHGTWKHEKVTHHHRVTPEQQPIAAPLCRTRCLGSRAGAAELEEMFGMTRFTGEWALI